MCVWNSLLEPQAPVPLTQTSTVRGWEDMVEPVGDEMNMIFKLSFQSGDEQMWLIPC